MERRMAHVPVLTEELVDILDVRPDSRVVDCTFGAGGHASAVARLLSADGMLLACDRDPVAERYFRELRGTWPCSMVFHPGNFAETLSRLNGLDMRATHVYMDLGVSSMQVDTEDRVFSYSYDAPLDMRMDSMGDITAAKILNEWEEEDLGRVFREYGEERYARRIARAVNDELGSLRRALPEAVSLLEPDGVLAVISFHSLEDRIVKEFFGSQAEPCTCPPDFPICACGNEPSLEILTRKPVLPGECESELNPRSTSAKLRASRRL